MRTTLNLDDDVAARLAQRAKQTGGSLSRVANAAIRAGMRVLEEPSELAAYSVPTFDSGRPLVDVTDVGEALELLDDAP